MLILKRRAFGFSLTEAIQRHVESRMETALGPFARSVFR